MRRLLAIAPKIGDATSYWRAVGPLSAPEFLEAGWKVEWLRSEVDWTLLVNYDAVFMQRPWRSDHLHLMRAARSMNLPVWVDYDDDLLAVPASNPTHVMYGSEAVKGTIRTILQEADAVSVSTAKLKGSFLEFKEGVHLIPNAWNTRLYPHQEKSTPTKTIVWRGSSTHNEDIETHLEELVTIAERYPDWRWVLMGEPLYKLAKALDEKTQMALAPAADITDYFHQLRAVRPAVVVVPLHDNEFNRAKSNIAWQEATWAGAACVAPKWDEWNHDGVARYYPGKPGSFIQAFERAAKKPTQYAQKSRSQLPCCVEANKARISILEGLRR